MKHFFIILFVLLSMNVFAQNWAPFPLHETANWQIDYAWIDGTGCLFEHEVIYFVEGDTVIDSHTYQRVGFYGFRWVENTFSWGCEESPEYFEDIAGIFRVEGGKYYRHWFGEDELIYDFSLQAGDTLVSTLNLNDPLIIQSVDSVAIDGIFRKRQWLHQNLWMIDGIGSTYGFDQHLTQFENWSSLNCYSHYGIPLIGEGTYCNLINEVEPQITEGFTVSPNPSKGIFKIDLQQQYGYQVFDLFGMLVDEGNSSGQSVMDLTSQPNGIYILRVESEQGFFAQKLVKQ